ncbi:MULTISPECIES: DUF1697 domain-containing protein [Asticcacaulis]|uniref:DUF1697 domain-containing protein n=1 Tax=Asticcacaulis TaxID=76890 RepID=UPI001AE4BE59|nr:MULTISPECIES: DUF1697 domain-containing protein [Asticcacaulis]MBP2158389.1 uncharacterized protein (DUF1697 family) [Asticcacaulis solisilvae]MDR6799434.1 uncharacterized protein (DUF1697 family) [Asticcacaulis sp. BE141]
MTQSTVWIGLFRGINIGKHKMPMKELVKVLEAEGMTDVKTYIASGNVVFRSDLGEKALTERIEELVHENFGFRPPLTLITLPHLEKLLAANPFRDHEHKGKAQHIFFFRTPPSKLDREVLNGMLADNEAYHVNDEALYFYAPDGIGRSVFVEKMGKGIKGEMTARNLNTCETLRDMAAAAEKA